MTNFEEYVLESLTTQAKKWSDENKIDILINHYESNIDFYALVVKDGLVHSPAEIVDNDYNNLHYILFDKDEKIDVNKIGEAMEYYTEEESVYFGKDNIKGDKYLYSFKVPITRDFDKNEFLMREGFSFSKDEEIEF
ncbi:hypothetical protein ACGCUP_00055 [Eubacteriales bacterium KG125]